jgi:hypothetical protein
MPTSRTLPRSQSKAPHRLLFTLTLAVVMGCTESDKDGSGTHTDDNGEVIQCATSTASNEGAPTDVDLTEVEAHELGLETGQIATELAVGDINGDGWTDTVVYVLADVVMVYMGSEDGTFDEVVSLSQEDLLPRGTATADVDGDGIDDVLISHTPAPIDGDSPTTVTVYFGGDDFPSEPAMLRNVIGSAASLTAGDVDGDGRMDIVSEAAGTGFSIYFNEGDRTFSDAVSFGLSNSFRQMHAADLNQDGLTDIVGIGLTGGVSMALAEDDRDFADPMAFEAPLLPPPQAFIDVGDLDGNGGPDIATNVAGGEVWVLWNDGRAELELGRYCTSLADAPDDLPYAISMADFNGDATLDLAVVNGATQTLSVLGGTAGAQALRMPQVIDGSRPGSDMLGTDINGDGRPDIVALADGGLSIRLNLE